MKILYHHRTLADGAEGIHIREMVAALRGLGHDVRIVSLVGEDTQRPIPARARWKRIGSMIPHSLYELAELSYNVVGRRRLMQAVRDFRPDAIYDRYNSYCTAAVHTARRSRLPLLLEVNSPVAYERTEYEHLQLKFPRLAQHYERWICTRADQLFAVSSPLKDHLVNVIGVDPSRIAVLPNGANPATFDPDNSGTTVRERHRLQGCRVIGFVGILRPWHGVEMLMEAFAGLAGPELRLLVVGDGPIQGDLEALAERLRIGDRVTFTGRIPHTEVRDHVAAMDVAVSPRATFYASPMKILEYMAMAKAVVAPDLANIRDIIEHGTSGMLFQPESVESLSECLRALLEQDSLRRQLGAEARRQVETRYNWRYNAEQVVSAVEKLRGQMRLTPSSPRA